MNSTAAASPVTVIIPCAGRGSRLGLPFPKELAPLGPGFLLITSSLQMIRESSSRCRVLLIDDGGRQLTARHVCEALPGTSVATVKSHPDAVNLADDILRHGDWLGDVNILLLPDVVYKPSSAAAHPLDALADAIRSGSDFAFGAAPQPQESLSSLGALRTDGNVVLAYEDKPRHTESYDAAWGVLAFSGSEEGEGMRGLHQVSMSTSRARTGPFTFKPIAGAPVVWLDGFRDCGTWTDYADEIKRR